MRGFNWIMRRLAVLMLLLSLGSTPLMDALTPGTLVAEADHAAWHAEKGEVWQADNHQHHDSTDHDHAWSVILLGQATQIFDMPTATELDNMQVLSGATRDGPRRPPRETV